MNAVHVKNLTVAYDRRIVLNDISFEVPKGSLTAVIGPNGSGKSTLIKALLDLIPYQGRIKIFNQKPSLALNRIGYVPQYFDFDRTMPITVREFLSFISPVQSQQATQICREVKIDNLSNKLIGELSGGQLQRVLIAQALYKNPDLLLMDEPSTGIDIEGAKTFYEVIEHLNKEHGVTILLISHEINVVYKIADQIICLNTDLICNGPPRYALTEKVIHQLYGPNHEIHRHNHQHKT